MTDRRAGHEQRESGHDAGDEHEVAVSPVTDDNGDHADRQGNREHRCVPVAVGETGQERHRDEHERQSKAMHNAQGGQYDRKAVDVRCRAGRWLSHGQIITSGRRETSRTFKMV